MKLTFSLALFAASINAVETESLQYAPQQVQGQECPDMSHLENLDTAEYQASSAYCKSQYIWERVNRNLAPERFFVGNEF